MAWPRLGPELFVSQTQVRVDCGFALGTRAAPRPLGTSEERTQAMSAKKEAKTRPSKQPSARSRSSQPGGKRATGKKAKVKRLSRLEVQLRKTLAEMGLTRARRVFAQVEASFDD